MPILLRIEMIVVAVSFMALVFRTVNRKKLKLQYSLLWIVVSFGMIIVSFIPQVAMWFASVMRIQTTSNLILFLGVVALLAITFLTPVLGSFFGFLIPLAVVLFVLIILHPYAPKVLNNVGFAYLTVACIDAETFAANLPLFFATYILGSLAFNGVCVLLMKPAKALAVKSVQRTQSETA